MMIDNTPDNLVDYGLIRLYFNETIMIQLIINYTIHVIFKAIIQYKR